MRFFFVTFLLFIVGTWSICPNNSVEWKSQCYFFMTNLTGFEDAELSCIQIGGHLSSIHDMFTNNLLAQEANKYFHDSTETDFWIGGNKLQSNGNWTWTDETPLDFTDWNKGEPQNITGSNCVAQSLTDGTWSAKDCFKSNPFVCNVSNSTTTTPSPTRPPFVNCSDGWTYFYPAHSCYGVSAEGEGLGVNWTTAENYCQSLGAHLPSIHSFEEFRFLESYVYFMWSQIWTGAYTADGGRTWKNTDGSPADFLNFGPWCNNGSPGNIIGRQSIIAIGNDASKDCYWNRAYTDLTPTICKKLL